MSSLFRSPKPPPLPAYVPPPTRDDSAAQTKMAEAADVQRKRMRSGRQANILTGALGVGQEEISRVGAAGSPGVLG